MSRQILQECNRLFLGFLARRCHKFLHLPFVLSGKATVDAPASKTRDEIFIAPINRQRRKKVIGYYASPY
jgi:hypothetical protein